MFAFGLPGGWEWLALLAIVLVLFGHRIPGMARNLGSGISEFKKGLKEGSETKPPAGPQDQSLPKS